MKKEKCKFPLNLNHLFKNKNLPHNKLIITKDTINHQFLNNLNNNRAQSMRVEDKHKMPQQIGKTDHQS